MYITSINAIKSKLIELEENNAQADKIWSKKPIEA